MDAQELKRLLDYHDNLYYNNDDPEISDEEYDVLRNKYIELTGENYSYVPGEAQFNRTPHTVPIQSLDKVQIGDEEKLRKEIARLLPVVIEPKFDGFTVVDYPDNKLVTRGDGLIGEDISEAALKVPDIINIGEHSFPLRMEVIMTRTEFNRINAERLAKGKKLFKNPRNAAAGMLRNKDTDKVEGLTCFIYDVMAEPDDTLYAIRHSIFLQMLKDEGMANPTPHWVFYDVDSAVKFIKEFDRTTLDYDIDGLVVKSDIPYSLKEFGSTGHHPKNAFAVKFEAKGAWTKIKSITWQVGRNQIAPVAELEPVEIDGSLISRCTLHNISIIKAIGLDRIYHSDYIQTMVYVIKANDVIPRITKVRHMGDHTLPIEPINVDAPTGCPSCEEKTFFDNDILKCSNPDCPAKLLSRLTHMAKRDALDIVGMSEETARKILDKFPITHPAQVFLLKSFELETLPGFAKRSTEKLCSALYKASMTDANKALYAAGIPLIGRTVSKELLSRYTMEELIDIVEKKQTDKITTIEGIGNEIAKSLIANWHMFEPFLEVLAIKDLAKKKVVDKKEQLTFCITGTFSEPREYFVKLIEDAGHKVSKSLSAKTDYLLAGEKAGSKLAKARELAVTIATTEEALRNVLGIMSKEKEDKMKENLNKMSNEELDKLLAEVNAALEKK